MSENFALENLVALSFVNLSKDCALEVLEARNAVREFMLTRRIISCAEHFRFIESLRNNKNNAYFAVYEVDSNKSALRGESQDSPKQSTQGESTYENSAFMGVICLNNIDLANKNATMGIYSALNAHNGAKLLKILRFIAFSELNLHTLYAKVISTNKRAIRFYEKSGFMRCGAMIEAIKEGEKFIDLEIWALKNDSPTNPRPFPSLRDLAFAKSKQSK